MKTRLKKAFAIVLMLCIVALSALAYFAGSIMEFKTKRLLQKAGFDHSQINYDFAYTRKSSLVISRINLDEDGFSTIRKIEVPYSLWSALTPDIKQMVIIQPSLTAILHENGMFEIDGLKTLSKLRTLPVDEIIIRGGQIDIITPNLGGVSVAFHGVIADTNETNKNINLILESQQQQLSFRGQMAANIHGNGTWQADITFDQGKLKTDELELKRANGQTTITPQEDGTLNIHTVMGAGAMTLGRFSWQNINMTFDGTPQNFKSFAQGEAQGFKGVELGMSVETSGETQNIEGHFFAKNTQDLLQYLAKSGIPLSATPKSFLSDLPRLQNNMTARFAFTQPIPQNIPFTLENDEQSITMNGILSHEGNQRHIKLTAPPLFLENVFPLQEQSLRAPRYTGGTVLVLGDVNSEENTDSDIQFNGQIVSEIRDGQWRVGGFRFEDIAGRKPLYEAQTTRGNTVQFDFKLPLNNAIKHTGTTTLNFSDSVTNIQNAKVNIFGGNIEINHFTPSSKEQNFDLKFVNIDLKQLSTVMNINGLSFNGIMNGTLPIHYANNNFVVKNGVLKTSKGTIAIGLSETKLPQGLQGDDLRLETMRNALQNFNFNKLEIHLNGPLDGTLESTISASGKNPNLFEGRSVKINLKLQEALAPLFKNIIKAKAL